MADQQLTDPIAAVLNTISDQLVKLSENQKVLNDSQHGLLEKYQEEAKHSFQLLQDISDRLDQIEKTIYEDDWVRRTGGTNG
tara:strand:+ start:4149 stop:4394 length:246 start_codon:yes stop_codon:yes gene_type:complete